MSVSASPARPEPLQKPEAATWHILRAVFFFSTVSRRNATWDSSVRVQDKVRTPQLALVILEFMIWERAVKITPPLTQPHIPLRFFFFPDTLPLSGHSEIWHLCAFTSLDEGSHTLSQSISSRGKVWVCVYRAGESLQPIGRSSGGMPGPIPSNNSVKKSGGCTIRGERGGRRGVKMVHAGWESGTSRTVEAWHAFIHDIRPSPGRGTETREKPFSPETSTPLRSPRPSGGDTITSGDAQFSVTPCVLLHYAQIMKKEIVQVHELHAIEDRCVWMTVFFSRTISTCLP